MTKIILTEGFYTFANAKIATADITLTFPPRSLRIVGFNNNPAGWSVVPGTDKYNEGRVTIRGVGLNITADGRFASPRVEIMLSEFDDFDVKIESVTFGSRDCCIRPTFVDGGIQYEVCAQTLRQPKISGTQFSIAPISPNPFTGDHLKIDYSVGFDAETTIQIYNSNGDLVRTVFDGQQKEGKHSENVNVSDLASGAYSIIMISGPFEERQALIIVK